jgi:hypothetical protein
MVEHRAKNFFRLFFGHVCRARRTFGANNGTTMKHNYFKLTLLLLLPTALLSAQQEDKSEKAIKTVINRFFEGMEKGDTTLLRSTCMPEPVFQTYMADKDGKLTVFTEDFEEFVALVGTPTGDKFDERIEFGAIHAERSLASAWVPYEFFINGKLNHCGTNAFLLLKTPEGWKIQSILDTRRKGCK